MENEKPSEITAWYVADRHHISLLCYKARNVTRCFHEKLTTAIHVRTVMRRICPKCNYKRTQWNVSREKHWATRNHHTYPILRSPSLLSAGNNTGVVRRTDILVGSSTPLPDNRQVHNNENHLFNLQDSCAYYGNTMLNITSCITFVNLNMEMLEKNMQYFSNVYQYCSEFQDEGHQISRML